MFSVKPTTAELQRTMKGGLFNLLRCKHGVHIKEEEVQTPNCIHNNKSRTGLLVKVGLHTPSLLSLCGPDAVLIVLMLKDAEIREDRTIQLKWHILSRKGNWKMQLLVDDYELAPDHLSLHHGCFSIQCLCLDA